MLFLFTLLIVIIYPLLNSYATDLLDESCKVSEYICSSFLLAKVAVLRFFAKVSTVKRNRERRRVGEELL